MSALLQRASLLFEQERYDSAEEALRQHLTAEPEDPQAHRLLALCLANQSKYDEATRHAQQSVALDPGEAYSHYVLAAVYNDRNRLPEAQAAVESAIKINPAFAAAYGLFAQLQFRQHNWQKTLDAANEGLAIEPDNGACLNLRAMAEMKLGRGAAAASTLQDALQRNPDDPWAHANQGWVCLERGQSDQAIVHFKEALRLDPNNDWARGGIVEALKAKNFLYRWMLYYFLWMAKLPSQVQFGLMIGGYFGYRFAMTSLRANPGLAPILIPLIGLYVILALLTWLASPLSNLLLRLHPLGKHALSDDQRRGANVLLVALSIALAVLGVGLLVGEPATAGLAALLAVLIALPASAIYVCDVGWPRTTAWLMVAGLALLGAPAIAALMFSPASDHWNVFVRAAAGLSFATFGYAVLLSQFGIQYLTRATVRK